MAEGTYQVDPNTNDIVRVLEDGSMVPTDQESAFDGRLLIQDGFAVNPDNAFDRQSLGRQGPIVVNMTEQGIIEITSQTLQGEINRTITATTVQSFSGELTVELTSGEKRTIPMNRVQASKPGSVWFERRFRDETGVYVTQYVSYPLLDRSVSPYRMRTPQEIMATYSELTRILGPEESVEAGLLKWLASDAAIDVERFIRDEHGLPEDENVSEYFSEVARQLARLGADQMTYFTSLVWG